MRKPVFTSNRYGNIRRRLEIYVSNLRICRVECLFKRLRKFLVDRFVASKNLIGIRRLDAQVFHKELKENQNFIRVVFRFIFCVES